jgi:hypothetical protein
MACLRCVANFLLAEELGIAEMRTEHPHDVLIVDFLLI